MMEKVSAWVPVAMLLGGIALVAIGAATGNLFLVVAGLLLLGYAVTVSEQNQALQSWVDALGLNSVQEFVVIAILLGGDRDGLPWSGDGEHFAGLGWARNNLDGDSLYAIERNDEELDRGTSLKSCGLHHGSAYTWWYCANRHRCSDSKYPNGNCWPFAARSWDLCRNQSGALKAWAEVLGLDSVF